MPERGIGGRGVIVSATVEAGKVLCDYSGTLLNPTETKLFFVHAAANVDDSVAGKTEYSFQFNWRADGQSKPEKWMVDAITEPLECTFGEVCNG